MSEPLRLHRGSAGLDVAALRPGRDLVLDPAPEHGLALADGVAVDDHLDATARTSADQEALAALADWRERRGPALTVDGIDLGFVWEVELMAECFLPATRLRLALAAAGATAVQSAGLDEGLLAVARGAGLDVRAASGSGAGTAPPMPKARVPLSSRLIARLGVPPRVRGDVLALSYWHLEPVWRRLVADGRPRPVAAGVALPALGRGAALRSAARGGWSGHPTAAARARSARRVAAALDAAGPPADDLDARVLQVLRERAGETLARAAHWRRVVHARSLRAVVVPFDSAEDQRVLLSVAHDAGLPSLLVQHGFDARLNDPDKSVARHVALWSEHDRVPAGSAATTHVTGNPGAAHLANAPVAPGDPRRAVVLVEYPSRISARVDARVGLRHVTAALDLLARERPGSDVVVRPHPADPAPESYRALGRGRDLRVTVDTTTPIEPLMAGAGLCVGALSTATLQATALGVPTVFLDVTDAPRPWPFDGADGGLPRISGADAALHAEAAVEAARDALGARADATDRVVALISSLAAGT